MPSGRSQRDARSGKRAPSRVDDTSAPVTIVFSHRLEVRFRDCDALGHVNNAVYLTYLEQARFNHWRAIGLADLSGGADIPGVIVARVEIDYRRPAKFGDVLDVRLGVAAIGRTSFTYEYEIVDAEQQLIASARTVIVRFDYSTNRPVPMSDALKQALTGGRLS
jgi:acyl-CoA thioester hydrolase